MALIRDQRFRWTKEVFKEIGGEIHNNKYDYCEIDELSKITARTPVWIRCIRHKGFRFHQTVDDHINGKKGCPRCGGSYPTTLETFIEDAKEKHGALYGYYFITSDDINKGQFSIVPIHCHKCNDIFYQSIKYHLLGNGCNICIKSKGEMAVRLYLINHEFDHEQQYIFPELKRKMYDFALHDCKYIIEFDGIHHFKRVNFFSKTDEDFEKRKKIDVEKSITAIKSGYTLIRLACDINDVDRYLDDAFNSNCDMYISHKNIYEEHIYCVLEALPNIKISSSK